MQDCINKNSAKVYIVQQKTSKQIQKTKNIKKMEIELQLSSLLYLCQNWEAQLHQTSTKASTKFISNPKTVFTVNFTSWKRTITKGLVSTFKTWNARVKLSKPITWSCLQNESRKHPLYNLPHH